MLNATCEVRWASSVCPWTICRKLADRLGDERELITAGHVILESAMRLSSIFKVSPTAAGSRVAALIGESSIRIVPIDETTAHAAVAAFERYGKGRKSRAGLNFGDCLSYACAKVHGARLLFKGGDFAHTDVARA
jgi:ribonuclease VapC